MKLRRAFGLALASCSLAAALAGCSADSRRPEQAQRADGQARAAVLADQAYRPRENDTVVSSAQAWQVDGQRLPVTFTLPSQGRGLPVVVYLPGLGESDQSGVLWRQAWAHAGYAVLSVQLLDEDAQAWRSDLARAGEFKTLSQQRHTRSALRQRVDRLAQMLAEAHRQAAAGNTACARLDFTRMAVAGFDLGAQAAMALAGERDAGEPALPLTRQFRAAIVLSPVVAPGRDHRDRFDAVAMPVLSISSASDLDPTGWIESAAWRIRPFELMPAGDKFMLMLDGAVHRQLAGQIEELREATQDAAAARQAGGEHGNRRDRAGKGTDRKPNGSAGTVGSALDNASAARVPPARERHGSAEFNAAIAAVSVAFLDASLRDRAQARQWLNAQVPDWLQDLGRWQQR